MSRRHCLLQIRDGRVYVKDLNSANGTAINGVNLTPQKEDEDDGEQSARKAATITPRFREAIIKDGDKMRIGLLMMRVSFQG